MQILKPLLLLASLLVVSNVRAADDYKPGPDSLPQPGVPKGETIKGTFDQSKVFPGTTRDYTVYLPQQLDRTKPAPVMVLQDGGGFSAPVVFDNLIHKRKSRRSWGVRDARPREGHLDQRAGPLQPQLRIRRPRRRLRKIPAR